MYYTIYVILELPAFADLGMPALPLPHRVLIAGAGASAGDCDGIGSALQQGLRARYRLLRLTDMTVPDPAGAGEEVTAANLCDADAAYALGGGIDCIVHLAGIAREDTWPAILAKNVEATVNVFEAARKQGVRQIVFASSNHVIGCVPSDQEVTTDGVTRPDSRYAVNKVFGEALGRLYFDKYGIAVICLRIGSFRAKPQDRRQLRTWISPRDLTAMFRCAIETSYRGFAVFYGLSANRRNVWRDGSIDIGFRPQDDARSFAAQIEASATDAWPCHSGSFCVAEPAGSATVAPRPPH